MELTCKHEFPDALHQILSHDSKEEVLGKVAKNGSSSKANEDQCVLGDILLHLFVVSVVICIQNTADYQCEPRVHKTRAN